MPAVTVDDTLSLPRVQAAADAREEAASSSPIAGRPETPAPWQGTEFVGRRIGDYEVVRVIGQGGMGVVFEARQERPQRSVALKMMASPLGTAADRARNSKNMPGNTAIDAPAGGHAAATPRSGGKASITHAPCSRGRGGGLREAFRLTEAS